MPEVPCGGSRLRADLDRTPPPPAADPAPPCGPGRRRRLRSRPGGGRPAISRWANAGRLMDSATVTYRTEIAIPAPPGDEPQSTRALHGLGALSGDTGRDGGRLLTVVAGVLSGRVAYRSEDLAVFAERVDGDVIGDASAGRQIDHPAVVPEERV